MKTLVAFILIVFSEAIFGMDGLYLEFRAAISGEMSEVPGHVFVYYSGDNVAYGFHGDGIRQETNHRYDVSYRYRVTPEQYVRALRVVDRFQGRRYFPGSNDCRFFAAEVARVIGLAVPQPRMTQPPAEWLSDLANAN